MIKRQISGPLYVTQEDVAEILKTTRQTIHRWMKEGRLKKYKIGRLVRTTLEDVAFIMQPADYSPIPKSKEFFLSSLNGLYETYFIRHPERRGIVSEQSFQERTQQYAERYAI